MRTATAIRLYTKPECPLCDKAEALLEAVRGRWPVTVDKINILTDPVLYDRYRHRIPVLEFAAGTVLEPPITRERLIAALRSPA